jgi:hypothetical protein
VSQTPLALKRFPFVAMAMQEQTLLAAGNNNVFSMPWVSHGQTLQLSTVATKNLPLNPNPRHSVNDIPSSPPMSNISSTTTQPLHLFDPMNLAATNGVPRSPGSPSPFGKESGNGIQGNAFLSSCGSAVMSSIDTAPRFNPNASGFKKYPGMPASPSGTLLPTTPNGNCNGVHHDEGNEESDSSNVELSANATTSQSPQRNNADSALSNDIQKRDQDDNSNRQISIPQNDNCTRYLDITPHLNLPQSDAAKKLGIPTSTLSKRWKEAVRTRKWPYRAICKLDKEIMTLLHNIPQGHDPSGQLPEDIETTLGYLLRRRQEELKPVVIRL